MGVIMMRWPQLGIEVRCEKIEANPEAFDVFAGNLPVSAVQGHDMVGGWILRNRAVHLRKRGFDTGAECLVTESLRDAPVGRVSLLFPQGHATELVVKYGDCVDNWDYIPVAQVHADDLDKLAKAGKAQWRSATRTKEVMIVEFAEEGGGQ